MKLATHLSLLFIAISSFVCSGQEIKYTDYKDFDFRSEVFSVVGKVSDLTYVYRTSRDGYYLDAYDDQLNGVATIIVDFLPKTSYKTKFIPYSDKILVLYQASEGSDVKVYGALLDARGRLMNEPVELDEVRSSTLGGNSGLYSYAVSADKKTIAIYGAASKGGDLSMKVILVNDKLVIQSEEEYEYNTENRSEFGEGVVLNSGKFYLPVYTTIGNRDFADRVWLLSVRPGNKELSAIEMELSGMYASGTYMETDKSGATIFLGGFYSDKRNGNFEGVIFTSFKTDEDVFAEVKQIPFSQQLRSRTGEKNTRRALNDYRVKKLVIKNDGGFVLIAEEFFVFTRSSYSPGFGYYSWYYPTMTNTIREYNYNDILCISYDANGQVEWSRFIPKNQFSQEDRGLFSSFEIINTGGSLGFLYNDFNQNWSRVQLASLDISGKLERHPLAAANSDNPDWLPRYGKQIAANEYMVPCLKRNKICFAKVVF